MLAQQRRQLRTLSNTRFGRAKARKLRREGGELAFLPMPTAGVIIVGRST
jgi:hypothetical protein